MINVSPIWLDTGFQTELPQTMDHSLQSSTSLYTLGPSPQSNGKAENSVKTAKQILKKAFDVGRDPQLSLLDFRNTPLEGMDSSPAQRLFSRRTRTSLPMASQLLQPQLVPDVGDKLQERKVKQALYYNRGAKVLQPLQVGDVVRV